MVSLIWYECLYRRLYLFLIFWVKFFFSSITLCRLRSFQTVAFWQLLARKWQVLLVLAPLFSVHWQRLGKYLYLHKSIYNGLDLKLLFNNFVILLTWDFFFFFFERGNLESIWFYALNGFLKTYWQNGQWFWAVLCVCSCLVFSFPLATRLIHHFNFLTIKRDSSTLYV